VTEAERRAGQRLAVLRGTDAVADLRARLADRDGVAATIYQAVSTQRCVLVQTYWMTRWTGTSYHVILTPTGADPVIAEMFLPDGASELVLASSPDGKVTTNPRSLAEWLGL
jgi:hypothetical protein